MLLKIRKASIETLPNIISISKRFSAFKPNSFYNPITTINNYDFVFFITKWNALLVFVSNVFHWQSSNLICVVYFIRNCWIDCGVGTWAIDSVPLRLKRHYQIHLLLTAPKPFLPAVSPVTCSSLTSVIELQYYSTIIKVSIECVIMIFRWKVNELVIRNEYGNFTMKCV